MRKKYGVHVIGFVIFTAMSLALTLAADRALRRSRPECRERPRPTAPESGVGLIALTPAGYSVEFRRAGTDDVVHVGGTYATEQQSVAAVRAVGGFRGESSVSAGKRPAEESGDDLDFVIVGVCRAD